MAANVGPIQALSRRIVACERCVDLRAYCAAVAKEKRKAYADQVYWGRPVGGFGDARARMFIVGLAPAAHGANRTGRMFTGDRSGDFLYAALHRTGLANQPTSTHVNDGLKLKGVYIAAALRCAPPGNKPTPGQLANCRGFLAEELAVIQPRVVVALGAIALRAVLAVRRESTTEGIAALEFRHGAEYRAAGSVILCSYHVSQQNTFTGRLTEAMFDSVLERAKAAAGLP